MPLTENNVVKDGSFNGHEDAIFKKMMDKQSLGRQRSVAESLENDELKSKINLTDLELKLLKDYTIDGRRFNSPARQGQNASDQMKTRILPTLDSAILKLQDNKLRVLYRFMAYRKRTAQDNWQYYDITTDSPWHSRPGISNFNRIKKGDIVSDLGYMSTSAHRGFLNIEIKGVFDTKYVKFALLTTQGANIASISCYTNAAERKNFLDQKLNLKERLNLFNRIKGPPAGQAEVLLPRLKNFEVVDIKEEGKNVYVLLQDAPRVGNQSIRCIITGEPILKKLSLIEE